MWRWLVSTSALGHGQNAVYHALPEDHEGLHPDGLPLSEKKIQKLHGRAWHVEEAATIALVLSLCAFTLSTILRVLAQQLSATDAACMNSMSAYSPMKEAVQYEWVDRTYRSPNIYAGYPTTETEEAWDDLLYSDSYFGFPYEKLHSLNKSLSTTDYLRASQDHSLTLGTPEMYHQVHCVNYLRQKIYSAHYNYTHFQMDPARTRLHVDHCIMVLQINILCRSDVTPVLFTNTRQDTGSLPTTETAPHKCPKWDLLGKWMEIHTLYKDESEI